jgi:quercetin dioxygenase-like cupin family protein
MHSLIGKLALAAALVACAGVGVVTWSDVAVKGSAANAVFLEPDELHWSGNPQLHGMQTAPLYGDSRLAQPYAERIRMPAHFRLPPHSHPNDARMVVVLSGTLYYAFGETFDEKKLIALPPGSFFTEPKNAAHYAMTKDKGVVLQLNAIGPAGTKYVGSGR